MNYRFSRLGVTWKQCCDAGFLSGQTTVWFWVGKPEHGGVPGLNTVWGIESASSGASSETPSAFMLSVVPPQNGSPKERKTA